MLTQMQVVLKMKIDCLMRESEYIIAQVRMEKSLEMQNCTSLPVILLDCRLESVDCSL